MTDGSATGMNQQVNTGFSAHPGLPEGGDDRHQ